MSDNEVIFARGGLAVEAFVDLGVGAVEPHLDHADQDLTWGDIGRGHLPQVGALLLSRVYSNGFHIPNPLDVERFIVIGFILLYDIYVHSANL